LSGISDRHFLSFERAWKCIAAMYELAQSQDVNSAFSKLTVDVPLSFLYSSIIDLLLAELCSPRDWHRALSELPFQK
jgi:hypothetical protein